MNSKQCTTVNQVNAIEWGDELSVVNSEFVLTLTQQQFFSTRRWRQNK